MHNSRSLEQAIRLALAASVALVAPAAWAQASTTADRAEATRLDTIQVSALAMGEDGSQIASPYSIVPGQDLLEGGAATLGDALEALPGVHSDTFGGGSSRPVIRGQTAPRVKVLTDGASILDASDISPDHTVTADPLLAERIEVLRGPATLLYGSGAVGGVVNVLDNKIPTMLPENGWDGMFAVRGNTVANERAAAAAVTGQFGASMAFHVEGSDRDADDYRVPDWEEHRVDGTFSEARNASAGLSWIGDNGYVGMAYSYRDDAYGLPGHSHEYESCHPHGTSLHCGSHGHDDDHDHDDEHEHDHAVPTIDLLSRRIDLRGEFEDPFAGFSRIRFRASDTDYRHDELEENEIATRFTNTGHEGRVELQHVPLGAWSGIVGLQWSDTRFGTRGTEAFLPTVDTKTNGLFVVEHVQLDDAWHLELGARHEEIEHTPVNDARNRPAFDDGATSFSGAAIWEFAEDTALSLSVSRSERLPHAQELYARGVHLATNTYECGLYPSTFTCGGAVNDADIDVETSHHVELGVRRTAGDLTFSASVFRNAIDDYIYARTLDRYEDFRLIKYTQDDATFRGVEAEVSYRFSDVVEATLFGDRVRADFDDGSGNLPRIPASRFGTRLNADWGDLSGEFEYYRVEDQDRIADYESETPGYDMLNLTLRYTLGEDSRTTLFLRGSNLLDEQVWNHASFLASVVPLPGRNITAGLRYDF